MNRCTLYKLTFIFAIEMFLSLCVTSYRDIYFSMMSVHWRIADWSKTLRIPEIKGKKIKWKKYIFQSSVWWKRLNEIQNRRYFLNYNAILMHVFLQYFFKYWILYVKTIYMYMFMFILLSYQTLILSFGYKNTVVVTTIMIQNLAKNYGRATKDGKVFITIHELY